MADHTWDNRRSSDDRDGNALSDHTERAQHHGEPDYEHHRLGVLRNERGSILDFLITAMLSFFLIFAGVDYFTTIAQYQIAEHIMHYYLERARVEGYLPAQDQSNMIAKYASAQMNVISISVTNQGTPITAPLERNTDNPDASEIDLLIIIKPYQQPFTTGLLIGASAAPSSYRIKVGGSVLSEYVST
jgi:hypothetical protein